MIKISKKAKYGLRVMIYLAKNKGRICSTREISQKEKIPFDYLEKIFSELKKAKLVTAKKGVKGGYFLAKNPKEIKIAEIIKVLEGERPLVECLKYSCQREKSCLAKKFWKRLNKVFANFSNSISLATLIKK